MMRMLPTGRRGRERRVFDLFEKQQRVFPLQHEEIAVVADHLKPEPLVKLAGFLYVADVKLND